jgi:hypothetical protein
MVTSNIEIVFFSISLPFVLHSIVSVPTLPIYFVSFHPTLFPRRLLEGQAHDFLFR